MVRKYIDTLLVMEPLPKTLNQNCFRKIFQIMDTAHMFSNPQSGKDNLIQTNSPEHGVKSAILV